MIRDLEPLAGYPAPYDLLCSLLQDATNDWRRELLWFAEKPGDIDAKMTADVMTWRPRKNCGSIGAIMLHMIHAEIFWFEKIALGRVPSDEEKAELLWNETDVDRDIWPEPPAQPMTWYLALQDRYRARTLEAIKSWPAADTLVGAWEDKVSMRWMIGHVVQHEAYHGGQIIMLYEAFKNRELSPSSGI